MSPHESRHAIHATPLAAHVQAALTPHLTGDAEQVPPLVDRLLAEAYAAGASDIHLTARRDGFIAAFRIDGDLIRAAEIPRALQDLVIQRLKIMARLVVYQRREPQDGRIDVELGGRALSLRAAFLPTLRGEQIVIRFPDPRREQLALADLGMGDALRARFTALIERPQGAVLLTGPASCGKSTTISAALRHLVANRAADLNILSIEDPIETEVDGISQTQIDPGAGLGFPEALRAALRHDPNVLVVGEIRDPVTAQTAIQAALTGHLLIASIHAGSAPGVFTRLAQMGVERYLLATAVSGVLSQRLARSVCRVCAEESPLSPEFSEALGIESDEFEAAVALGCPRCHGTGCRGRTGAFALLTVTDLIAQAILENAPEHTLAELALQSDQPTLRDALIEHVAAKRIGPQEALRLL
jgi:general secretion pathway protein E